MKKDFISFPKIPRLSRNCIVTEKIDGTNAQILIAEDGEILAGSRNRWLAPAWEVEGRDGIPYIVRRAADNHNFAKWVEANKELLIKELGVGRHFGEWWGEGINRGYGLKEKRFTLFNVTKWENVPLTICSVVPVLYRGIFDTMLINGVFHALSVTGSKAVPGYMNPEGIVVFHEASGHLYKKTLGSDGHKEATCARCK